MYKLNPISMLSGLLTFLFVISITIASAQSKSGEKFVHLIFKIEAAKNGTMEAEIVNLEIIDGRLKRKTKARNIMMDGSDYIDVIFRGSDGGKIEQIKFPDPFTSVLEYVDEDENYQHHDLVESSKVFNVRIPYTEEITDIQVKGSLNGKESTLLSESINK